MGTQNWHIVPLQSISHKKKKVITSSSSSKKKKKKKKKNEITIKGNSNIYVEKKS